MIYESPFGLLPAPPSVNAHDYLLQSRPEGFQTPLSKIVHVDAVTGTQRTYGEFLARVNACARELCTPVSQGGLGLPDHKHAMVGVYSDNSLDLIVLIHALLKSAIPFALISSYATPFELKHALTKSGATHIFLEPSRLSTVRTVCKDKSVTLKTSNIFYIEGKEGDTRTSVESLVQSGHGRARKNVRLTGGETGGFKSRPADKDTLAYLVFSSGTSGLPKAVMISHGNIIFSMMQFGVAAQDMLKFRPLPPGAPEPCVLGFLPIYHSYGLYVYVFRSLVTGSTIILMPRWNLPLALESIPKYKVNALTLIPSIIHTMLHSPLFKSPTLDLSSVTAVGSGAAYLPPSLAREFVSHFPSVPKSPSDPSTSGTGVPSGYGMSELSIAASMGSVIPGMCNGKIKKGVPVGSVGVLLPGMQARIMVEEEGKEGGAPKLRDAKPGEPGELWLRGYNVALGYYKDPKSTRSTFGFSSGKDDKGGWLRTGDTFRIDEDGFLFFEDRGKDTLKISGLQVSPREIEAFLLQSPDTAPLLTDVAVAGVITSHSSRTEDELVPRAWVVPSLAGRALGERKLTREVTKSIEGGLSKYKWLRGGVEIVDEIPKNPTGKVLKRVLVDRYNSRHKSGHRRSMAKL